MRPKGSALVPKVGVALAALILGSSVSISHAASTPSPAPTATQCPTASPTPSPTVLPSPAPISTPTPTSSPTPSTSPFPQPRKILSGWIPYYSMKTSLPSAILNADLIQQVSPFWYSLKDQNTIQDLYTPANPSVPMCIPLQSIRDAGFKVIPSITDGTAVDPKTGKTSQLSLIHI